MQLMTKIKEYLFGKPIKNGPSPMTSITPKGIIRTIVPKEYQGKKAPIWDEDMFKNKIYIQ